MNKLITNEPDGSCAVSVEMEIGAGTILNWIISDFKFTFPLFF